MELEWKNVQLAYFKNLLNAYSMSNKWPSKFKQEIMFSGLSKLQLIDKVKHYLLDVITTSFHRCQRQWS